MQYKTVGFIYLSCFKVDKHKILMYLTKKIYISSKSLKNCFMAKSYFLFVLFFVSIFISCTKTKIERVVEQPIVCDVKGVYFGTSASSTGATSTLAYYLEDNNFARSSVTLGGSFVTFGGYRNTCDSVIISVRYTSNNSYYLLKGKLLENRTKLSGTFVNLTTPTDNGTFMMTKQ